MPKVLAEQNQLARISAQSRSETRFWLLLLLVAAAIVAVLLAYYRLTSSVASPDRDQQPTRTERSIEAQLERTFGDNHHLLSTSLHQPRILTSTRIA